MNNEKLNRKIPRDDHSILSRCRSVIQKIDGFADVILYGSRARGEYGRDSDYDFLILVDGEVTARREEILRDAMYDIELETGKVLTVFAVSRSDWNSPLFQTMPFHQNVTRDGIEL